LIRARPTLTQETGRTKDYFLFVHVLEQWRMACVEHSLFLAHRHFKLHKMRATLRWSIRCVQELEQENKDMDGAWRGNSCSKDNFRLSAQHAL
jgi:hypothetical protein